MEIIGYSERGLINSLFYEIKYSNNNLKILNELLSLACFPYRKVDFQITEAKILIEQSFSDFGDADVVFMLNNNGNKQTIFIEAKVKTFQGDWSILKEFEKFSKGMAKSDPPKGFSSNLFVQLYLKMRLIKALKLGGIEELKKGLQFPKSLLKKNRKTHDRNTLRKIGNNEVVLKATEQLVPYCTDTLFVVLVPDNKQTLNNFFQNKLKNYKFNEVLEWNVENWGYISWEDVENFCYKNGLKETLTTFRFNNGQIYEKTQ